jgi:predicted ribosome quality control (RQC) complex YloA/Tae2 family protein
MKTYNSDDNLYVIYVGENASENWKLLKQSKKYHLFFHLTCFSSCFVLVKSLNDVSNIYPRNLIYKCAEICKNHTKYKNLTHISVDYCMCENVSVDNDSIGSVRYKNNKKVKRIKI